MVAASARQERNLTHPDFGLGLGIALMWFSLLVFIPLTAVLVQASPGGWSAYWDALTSPQTLAALRLTVGTAVLVTAVNVVMGTTIAWVLVRDQFPGKPLLDVVIDMPFALPTIVAAWCCSPCTDRTARWASTGRTPRSRFPGFPLRDAALRRAHGPARAPRARARGRGGGGLARRQSVDDLPAHDPAEPRAGDRRGSCAVVRRAISEYGSLVLLSGNLPY